jgi:hypothetical protein
MPVRKTKRTAAADTDTDRRADELAAAEAHPGSRRMLAIPSADTASSFTAETGSVYSRRKHDCYRSETA